MRHAVRVRFPRVPMPMNAREREDIGVRMETTPTDAPPPPVSCAKIPANRIVIPNPRVRAYREHGAKKEPIPFVPIPLKTADPSPPYAETTSARVVRAIIIAHLTVKLRLTPGYAGITCAAQARPTFPAQWIADGKIP